MAFEPLEFTPAGRRERRVQHPQPRHGLLFCNASYQRLHVVSFEREEPPVKLIGKLGLVGSQNVRREAERPGHGAHLGIGVEEAVIVEQRQDVGGGQLIEESNRCRTIDLANQGDSRRFARS